MIVWLWFTSIDEFCRSVWASLEELTDMCYFCFWYHHTLHPSFRGLIYLLLLICQPGESGQLLAEVEGWKSLFWLPTSQNCQIHMFVVVAFCKVTLVKELHSRKKPIHSPNFQHYKFVFWVYIGVDVHDFITMPVFTRC